MILSVSWAIDSVPAGGERVFPADNRTYSFSYHTGNEDLNWYGSPQWAVLFDFKAAYPSLSLAQFAVSGAQIWFPVIGDSVTVELFSDNSGQPGTRISQVRGQVTQNLMQFSFPSTIQTEKIWLLITYNTHYYGPYISASNGGGSHSYYLNTNVSVPYFQSMAAAGFNCEFLMSVQGEFLLSNPDLELQSFALEGDLVPGATVAPKFTIYNHSNLNISNASIDLQIFAPASAAYSYEATIPITGSIAPHSSLSVDATSPDYQNQHFQLPPDPMQLKLRALLSSENVADTLFNNGKTVYYNIFEYDNPETLTENFLRNSEVDMIANAQNDPGVDALRSLYYFPVLSDSLSSLGAVNRFSWYSLFSTPVTVMGGNSRITGYSPSYQNLFQEQAQSHAQDKTMISTSQTNFELPQQGENLQIRISLRNVSTHLFNTATEPNLLSSSRFFVAFFKKTSFGTRELYVFNRWIAFADTISGNLYAGQESVKSYQTSLSNIDLDDLSQNYRLYYWLQLNDGGKILFSDFSDLSAILASSDEVQVPPAFSCYPNPLVGSADLFIKGDQSVGASCRYSVFNLRGQMIWRSPELSRSELPLKIPHATFANSGVYIIRMETRTAKGKTAHSLKKITVLKGAPESGGH